MKKIVSFFGSRNEMFEKLNRRAAIYAEKKGLSYEWVPMNPFDEETVIRNLNQADAGIIDVEPYGESIFGQLSERVKLLVRFGVGYDKVDIKAADRHGIFIARTTGANTIGVAEMALTLMMASRRQLKMAQRLADTGCWEKAVVNETVGGTIGIVGFGAIGKAFAKLIGGFGCRIIAYDPNQKLEEAAALGVELVDLNTLFQTADAITLHIPYLEETRHLVNEHLLGLMKPEAVIVNTSRGGIIDEEALYRVCRDGKIRGAALDVFEQEPLPVTSKLTGLDRVLLSPHLSSQTEESLWRIYAMSIDIAAGFFSGEASPHILNPADTWAVKHET